ncbi:Mu P family protein [Rhizobium sp. CFBP 8762]|uniref:phage baseplate assembly protein n=1 Tax=Rhizobium sp. CFBP 8762 TaxID=2775279 RepID=UPI0017832ABD|nr:Mu P family protein [Rhizobium sp. CFBP 8762]MBD8554923.1 Mu P family protein [Rhizobium sp. CFBP 8762]
MKGITLRIDGVPFDQWESGEVSRDMKDFSGSFSFTFRDGVRSAQTFDYASLGAPFKLRPGHAVDILIDGALVLKGFIEKVSPSIDDGRAEVTVSGRDVTGDLIDSAALTDGPAEFKNVKLEEAVKRVAAPFKIGVRNEIDTGEPFTRYSLDLSETAFSAIEKGARSRHALILSDGVGNIVITRTGKTRAPTPLRLPGNILSSSATFSHENRHSETIVRGQGEKAGKERTGPSALDATAEPLMPTDRKAGDGSATAAERKGTAATGRVKDDKITRHRPIVHLARTKADATGAQDEADWRQRTARADGEEVSVTVKGFGQDGSSGTGGRVWRVNELVYVSDAFLDIERDLLVSAVTFSEDESGRHTQLTLTSPEAFDKEPDGKRRTNAKAKGKAKTKKQSGPLDGTAERL